MATNMGFTHLILGASGFVKAILLLLLLILAVTTFVIVKKGRRLRRVENLADDFEDEFWSGTDLASLYQKIHNHDDPAEGMEAVFYSGFQEFLRMRAQPGADSFVVVGSCQRAMRAAMTREVEELEKGMTMLASAGSISPYVGLLGTVWGIMNSFRALGAVKQASIAQVAPGIAEALVATAMGLIAAIPAVVAYNKYSSSIDRIANRYESFIEEFSNILQRQAISAQQTAAASATAGGRVRQTA